MEGLLIPKLRRQFAEFLQHTSLKRLGILYQTTCVGFGYGLRGGYFLEHLRCPGNPINRNNLRHPSLIHWPTNINVVPIDYGSRPRLRGRLTLRRLTLRRNPWSFGGRDSHSPVVTHVCIRASDTSRGSHESPFTGLRNAPLPLTHHLSCVNPRLRCVTLAPIHFRRRNPCLDQ
jgi:hypothetical protein